MFKMIRNLLRTIKINRLKRRLDKLKHDRDGFIKYGLDEDCNMDESSWEFWLNLKDSDIAKLENKIKQLETFKKS